MRNWTVMIAVLAVSACTTVPEQIQGISRIKQLRAQSDVLDARVELYTASWRLLQAQARWDYVMGDSPIDRATAPYEQQDRRTAEKRNWLLWWMSLIN